MRLMDQDTQNQVRNIFSALKTPVTLQLFMQELDCDYCKETQQIAEELAELSDLITLRVDNLALDKERAATLGVDKAPAMVVLGENEKDYRIRFFGIPSGYEFTSLIEAILLVGTGAVELDASTVAFLNTLETPLHLQVFVTPTCPYCPGAVVLAHKMAYASDKVTADMVEVTEFPHLGQRYAVMGVPRTVINEGNVYIEGAAPEQMLLEKLKAAARQAAKS
jgi:glutaredoxin-like protein